MAIIELTKENKPKLAVQVNNSLKYMDKETKELKDRTKETALIQVVKQASDVIKADKGTADKGSVMISLNTENGYKNYFVNNNKQDDIVLAPVDEKLRGDRDNYLFFNKTVNINNTKEGFYYVINKSESSQKLVDSIKLAQTDKADYLNLRVTFKNDELQAKIIEKEKELVVIGKDQKPEFYTKAEFQAKIEAKRKEREEQNKDIIPKDVIPLEIQDKQGNVIEQTTISKTSSYIPKAEQKTQTQQQEFNR